MEGEGKRGDEGRGKERRWRERVGEERKLKDRDGMERELGQSRGKERRWLCSEWYIEIKRDVKREVEKLMKKEV